MSWISGLATSLFSIWIKTPNPVAKEAYTAGVATQTAEQNAKANEVSTAQLQAVVNSSTDVVDDLNKGDF